MEGGGGRRFDVMSQESLPGRETSGAKKNPGLTVNFLKERNPVR